MKTILFALFFATTSMAATYVPVSLAKSYPKVTVKGCSCNSKGATVGCPKGIGCKRTDPPAPPVPVLSPSPTH